MKKEKTRQRKYHEKMLSKGLKYIHIYVPEELVPVYKDMAKTAVELHLSKEAVEETING